MHDDFQLAWHTGDEWPDWGSAPRCPLVEFDMAHKGEWLDSVIGPDVETGQPMIYHIVRCELCIGTHIWPLPKPEALAKYYAETFFQQDKPDYCERYERDRLWWERCVHGPILETCERYLPIARDVMAPRFLDVGTGPGIALRVAKARGWLAYGIEPNQAVCDDLARQGYGMMHGTLETLMAHPCHALDLETLSPHIIYLYEVLEHQPCPEDFVLRCWEALAPGGLLVIIVPNDYNPLQLEACERFGLPHWWISAPQHLFYFSPKTLQLLVRRAGFDILDIRGSYPLELFLLNGQNYIGNDSIGREIHTERMMYELYMLNARRWKELEQSYRENIQHREGREIILIARRRA